MGCCDSRVNSPSFLPDPKYSNKKPKEISLLLLGPGGSGKSTILKQMSKIYNGKIDNKLLIDATQYIRENIIEDIYWLCTAYNQLKKGNINVLPNNNEYMYNSNNSNNSNNKNFIIKDINNSNGNVSDGSSNSELLLESQYEEIIDYIYNIAKEGSYDDIKFDNKLANKIKTLWNIDLFQKLFQKRRQSHIMDHTPYFMNNIDRIAKPDYKATFDDYIRARHTTTGSTSYEFRVDIDNDDSKSEEWKVTVTDVGGQRTERKKWDKSLQNKNAIIYVMSLAAYDQVLFEDHTTNCYYEAFDAFKILLTNDKLKNMDIIVFLNKMDVFKDKITKVPFTKFDPKFNKIDEHNERKVLDYVKKKIEDIFYNDNNVQYNAKRRIDWHITSATDTKQIETVMHQTQYSIVRKLLQKEMLNSDQ